MTSLPNQPASEAPAGAASGHGDLMDRIYRGQRHIYDLTRKFYLFGRDGLLAGMRLKPGDQVCEIGCGTARNLIMLASSRGREGVRLYGLDASEQMLVTARAKIAGRGLSGRITVVHAFAEQLDPKATFGLDRPFDAVFFSYALSMIPPWKAALDAALASVKPAGEIHIVDFWDQGGWPRWFQGLLRWWLSLFHVKHEPALLEHLRDLEKRGVCSMTIESVGRRYAYRAVLRKL